MPVKSRAGSSKTLTYLNEDVGEDAAVFLHLAPLGENKSLSGGPLGQGNVLGKGRAKLGGRKVVDLASPTCTVTTTSNGALRRATKLLSTILAKKNQPRSTTCIV